MSRSIIIGDLHGCLDDALNLLDKCKVTADDHVLFLGDLIDRGHDSAGCLDLAMGIERRQGKSSSILGNHESKHLMYYDQIKHGKKPSMPPSHVATQIQLTEKHYEYMETMPLYVRFPEHNAVAVHAGVYPDRSIESQDPHHLLHIQMIKPHEYDSAGRRNTKTKWPSKVPDDTWKFWTNYWNGPERIIFGHSVLDKPLLTDKVCGIDGGSCFGGQLHAVILPSWEIVSVPGANNYGTRRDTIAAFNIHGDVKAYS